MTGANQRSRQISFWIVVIVLTLLTLWILSGLLIPSGERASDNGAPSDRLFTVRARWSEAELVDREVKIPGRTEPARSVTIRAETAGRIIEARESRGTAVSSGEWLVRLDPEARPAQLDQALALLRQREIEYQASQRLVAADLQSESQAAQIAHLLAQARQEAKERELELARTEIKAPFDGVLSDRLVEVGDYVSIGDPVAAFVELDPLIVVGHASEFDVALLKRGEAGSAALISGEILKGSVRYVDPDGDSLTRTFRIELAVENPMHAIPGGRSASIIIKTGSQPGHRISPAMLTLDDAGQVGVKYVDENDIVQFHPLEIIRSDLEAMWIAGLPDTVRLITVGHAFTQVGDHVLVDEDQGPPTDLPSTDARIRE